MSKELLPDLTKFSQPEWNEPQSLSVALDSVWEANDRGQSDAAQDRLMYAIGNNHAGTYYSVVLAIIPALAQVLLEGGPWAQLSSLEVLNDLYVSFQPEPGHELFDGEPLDALVRQSILELEMHVQSIAMDNTVAAGSAAELLAVFAEMTR